MVWSLVLLFALVLPCPAFADEVTPDAPSPDVVEDSEQLSDAPAEPVTVEVTPDESPRFSEDGLLISTVEEPVEPVARASLPSSVYGSVTPNQSYSVFAESVTPKIGWLDDYVFYRASQNEYYLVWGDLELSGSTFSGSDCRYIRWYYVNSSSGYVQSSGTGSLSLNVGDSIVLSSLGDYPVLSVDSVALHTGVFCVTVAVCCYAIGRMLSMLIRMGVRAYVD